MKKKIFRFAPSLTGPLHIGNIKLLLYNYFLYKKYNGIFILRIDEIKKNNKKKKKYIKYIYKTFKWLLNINFKKKNINILVIKQFNRIKIYRKYIRIMLKKKHAYYSYDTKKQLKNIKYIYKKKKKIFEYNYKTRTIMNNIYNKKFKKKYYKKKKFVIRYNNIPNKIVYVNDYFKKIKFNTENLNDVILFKSNGYPTYHFANIIDDYLLKVTHIIRGKEWISSTVLHILLYKSFFWNIPKYIHISTIINPFNRKKISKRHIKYYYKKNIPLIPIKYKNIKGFKELGYFRLSIINYLLFNNNKIYSIKNIINLFNLKNINNNNVIFNINKLIFYNKKIIQNISFKKLKKKYIYLLKKKKINIINYNKINKILFFIKNRICFYKDLLKESIFFFISPIKFIYKKKIKNINFLLKKIFFLIKNNNLNTFFNKKNIFLIKILRLLITGNSIGINIIILLKFFKKKELLKKIIFFKKFINK